MKSSTDHTHTEPGIPGRQERLLGRLSGVSGSRRVAEAGTSGSTKRIEQAGEVRSSSIESLRALAALAVLEGHVFGQAHGYRATIYTTFSNRMLLGGGFGVYLFFALTGYLLYKPFARRDFAHGRSLRYGRYAANRAFRILPLYYVVLVVYLLVFDRGGAATTWWRSALFLENFFPQTLNHVDGVMWSLVVEVQFYILLPFLALAISRLSRGSVPIAVLCVGAAGLLSELIRLATVTLVAHQDVSWEYSLPSTFVFFSSGMLLALLQSTWSDRHLRWLRGPSGRGDVWLLGGAGLWCLVCWRYDCDVLLVPASFLVVGAVVLPVARGWGKQGLEWRPLAKLGLASYSLYLWHFPIVSNLGLGSLSQEYLPLLAVMVPLCCAVAVVSYAVLGSPFLRLRRSWSSGAGALSDSPVALGVRPEPA